MFGKGVVLFIFNAVVFFLISEVLKPIETMNLGIYVQLVGGFQRRNPNHDDVNLPDLLHQTEPLNVVEKNLFQDCVDEIQNPTFPST